MRTTRSYKSGTIIVAGAIFGPLGAGYREESCFCDALERDSVNWLSHFNVHCKVLMLRVLDDHPTVKRWGVNIRDTKGEMSSFTRAKIPMKDQPTFVEVIGCSAAPSRGLVINPSKLWLRGSKTLCREAVTENGMSVNFFKAVVYKWNPPKRSY